MKAVSSVIDSNILKWTILYSIFFLQIIDKDINPYVDEWEAEGIFPAHKVFKTLGNAGILGVSKPTGMTN